MTTSAPQKEDGTHRALTNLPVTPQSDMERCLAICVKAGVYTIANPSRMMRCGKDATLSVFKKEPGVVRLAKIYRIPGPLFSEWGGE